MRAACLFPCFIAPLTAPHLQGEDGFEISIPNEYAEDLARRLLDELEVGGWERSRGVLTGCDCRSSLSGWERETVFAWKL